MPAIATPIVLRQTKVYHEDHGGVLPIDHEVLRLDVAMDQVLAVKH